MQSISRRFEYEWLSRAQAEIAKRELARCLEDGELPKVTDLEPGFADRVIRAQIRALGAEMLTFEKAAGKLDGARVL